MVLRDKALLKDLPLQTGHARWGTAVIKPNLNRRTGRNGRPIQNRHTVTIGQLNGREIRCGVPIQNWPANRERLPISIRVKNRHAPSSMACP
jgi:hypothetical protein